MKFKAWYSKTKYGFSWGAAKIERIASLDDGSVYISITTPKNKIDVRITRSGLIQVSPIEKIHADYKPQITKNN